MIAVVIPAHDEQELITSCLASAKLAALDPRLDGEEVVIVVALDSCSDSTEGLARAMACETVSVCARNVGVARAAGAQHALSLGARWLAFTDADSVVAPDWLSGQLMLQADAVCGTVTVDDWETYDLPMRTHYAASYHDVDGHRHIHGANLGVSAEAYRRVGGFAPLQSSEDVALVKALERAGAYIAWSALPRVVTSARRCYRAPAGFGACLERIELESSYVEHGLAGAPA